MIHKIAILIFGCVLVMDCRSSTQRDSSAQDSADWHYVMSPYPTNEWRFRGSVGLSLAVLPQPLTEYPTPAPMLDIRYRLSMPLFLTAYGRVGSNIATSLAQLGGMFSIPLDVLTIGAGYSIQYVYGNITYVDGFNTSQNRWINYPMVTASYRFPRATLTARLEIELTTSVESKLEDQSVTNNKDLRSGYAVTVALEQPFFGTTHVVMGATFQYSDQPYQAWFLYNSFSDKLFSSEFFMGIIL